MADPCQVANQPQSYQLQYEAAGRLFDEADEEQCIAEAKNNLSDPTLPRWYIIKNCILIACALDDWHEADVYRLTAEQTYSTTLEEATRKKDTHALEALHDLREELDELNEFRRQDLAALVDEMFGEYDMDTNSDKEEMDSDEAILDDVVALEEQEGVVMAENENEVAAEISLPIRVASEDVSAGPKFSRT